MFRLEVGVAAPGLYGCGIIEEGEVKGPDIRRGKWVEILTSACESSLAQSSACWGVREATGTGSPSSAVREAGRN